MIRALNLVFVALFAASFSRASFAQAPGAGGQTPMELQQQADKAYAEKSYARALELYRAAKAAGPVREPEDVDYRIVNSLYKTQKWDDAIVSANFALKNVTWKARYSYLLGRIYVQAPKSGWKLGDKIWRQDEYPEVPGEQKPQRIYLGQDDQKDALENLENAKIQAQKERDISERGRFAGPIYPLPFDQEIDLNFDLAAYLPQTQYDEFQTSLKDRKDTKFDEAIDPKAPYSRGWSLPKKVFTLYAEIRQLDQSADKADATRSLLAEGLFIRAYRNRMDSWAQRYDEAKKVYVKVAYPFDSSEPIPVWRRVVGEYPNSPLAPQTLLLIAQEHQNKGDLIKALATYRELAQKYSKTKWVSDAKAGIADIEAKEVNFNLTEPTRPGVQPKLDVTSRNVQEIQFAAYKVKLEEFLTPAARLNDPETLFTSWTKNFGTIADAKKKFGAPAFTWKLKTGDKRDHKGVSGKVTAPFSEVGAYAVVASAGDRTFGQIIVISDLALLKKADRDGSFVYVANAATGAPVVGANVVMKEVWEWNPRKVNVAKGVSNDAGFFDKKRASSNNSQVSAFAWVGNRYAITGQGYEYWRSDEMEGGQARVLGTTDRPVYRPGQKVEFRHIVTRRVTGGDWQPVVGKALTVQAYNPKGEKIFDQKVTTGEFGSVSGEFTLGDDVALGMFSVNVSDGQSISGGTQFRVEEYKRPEFEVTVTAPQEAKRPGETVAARINARYYFGSPVPNAKVKYTVRRSNWWASYQFPTPYDWLYSSWNVGYYDTGRRNIGGEGSGAIVKQGETTTDAQGYAELSFQTQPDEPQPNDWWSRYSNPLYTIEAEITDASRRTIEAQGQVKVARQEYFAFLDTKRGYFQKGDLVPVEIRTQDANDQPKAASGKMVVYRQLPGDKEEKVFEEAITTDATGRVFWNWEATTSGQFRVAYEAIDGWGKKVEASTEIWVVEQNMKAIRLRGVTLLLDKKSYEQGDTLKVAVVADKPGAQVLLTQEASGQILRRDLIKVDGNSRTVEIAIEKKHVPNFFIGAALVQDYEVYQAQVEVFVPPTRQLLDIKVKGDKATYKPGETGTFQVTARDWSGKPARAEVSLALVDASLFYIQKDMTPDVRQYLYGDRRQNSINLDSSRSGNPEARAEGPDAPNLETHNWELPDEFGQLQLMPGGDGYYPNTRIEGLSSRAAMRGGFGGAPPPMAAMAPASPAPMGAMTEARRAFAKSADSISIAAPETLAQAGNAPVQVRSNFSETAYWSPAVITDGGQATVKVTFPDSLTQWHASALGLTKEVQVGQAETDVATKKDLLVRLQTPRFFVERDQVVISANVHNYGAKTETIKVAFDFPSLLKTAEGTATTQDIVLASGEEKRIDVPVTVVNDGTAEIQVTARTATDSDGVKMSFPVLVHGAPRFAAQTGLISSDGKTTINLNFPKERQMGSSQLNLQLNPSLAATMLDALPYLADYPYGCVEQTMSRFLPSVIAERTLRDAGINLDQLRARAKAYEAEAKTGNVGERVKNTGYTFPKGQPNSRDLEEMASGRWWGGHSTSNNPVFDAAEMRKMVDEGLKRLTSMQRSDGGWGWFSGAPQSDTYMSAYVVYGLAQAQKAGVAVNQGVLDRGTNYLNGRMKAEDNIHLLTYIAYALSQRGNLSNETKLIAAGRLYEQRERLSAYSKSLLAMALWNAGEKDKAGVLVRNLENTVKVDAANGTARWQTTGSWWYWWNNDVETNAVALRAFNMVDPANKVTPMLMKWLTLQARGNHWRSTKETAEAVYSLADYVNRNKELDVDYTLKVNLNDKLVRTYRVTKDNALFFDNRFLTGDLFLNDGANTLTIEKTGKGGVYWNAYSEYFSLEDPIKASGNELEVSRRYFKLTRKAAGEEAAKVAPAPAAGAARGRRPIMPPRPVPQPAEPEYERSEIKDGNVLKSGDLVEVEMVVNAKNDYEYLIFEDMKAAGLEPVEVRSGYDYEDGLSYYVELRDEKAAFFVTNLPQGRRVLRYRLRAEVPGTFHALPTNGYAMYAPEVRAISDEMRLGVSD